MKAPSRILLGVIASLGASTMIALIALSVLRGMNAEFQRIETLGEILDKTHALHALAAAFKEESARSDLQQAKQTLLSLDRLLKGMSSRAPREQILIEQLRRSH